MIYDYQTVNTNFENCVVFRCTNKIKKMKNREPGKTPEFPTIPKTKSNHPFFTFPVTGTVFSRIHNYFNLNLQMIKIRNLQNRGYSIL